MGEHSSRKSKRKKGGQETISDEGRKEERGKN